MRSEEWAKLNRDVDKHRAQRFCGSKTCPNNL